MATLFQTIRQLCSEFWAVKARNARRCPHCAGQCIGVCQIERPEESRRRGPASPAADLAASLADAERPQQDAGHTASGSPSGNTSGRV